MKNTLHISENALRAMFHSYSILVADKYTDEDYEWFGVEYVPRETSKGTVYCTSWTLHTFESFSRWATLDLGCFYDLGLPCMKHALESLNYPQELFTNLI